MIAVHVTHSIKPVEVEGEIYALKKGDSAFIPSKLAGDMIKRGWAAKIQKPERLGEVEGVEVRDVSRWVKGISGEQINRLKIGKNGLAISFLDVMNVIAGKVYTPFSSSANNEQKESGFASIRVANIFSTFKKGEEARLWWKGGDNPALYIKESVGNLSWRHKLPRLEEAVKMPNLKKIPVAAIKIDINDITLATTINKGKRVAEKYDFVAFCYSGKNVTVYAIHEERYSAEKTIVKLNELEAIEGEGEGIAIYRLEHIQKLLKGTKKGIIRIEEDAPLKVSVGIGRESKAVAFLTPVADKDLRAQIAAEMDIKAPTKETKEELEELSNELKEEEIINGTAPKVDEDLRREKLVKDKEAEIKAAECLARLIKNSYTQGLIEDGLVMDAYTSALPIQKSLIEKWSRDGYTLVDWGTGYSVTKEDMVRHGAEARGYDAHDLHMIDLRKQCNYMLLFGKKNKSEQIKEEKKGEAITNEAAPIEYKDWTVIKEGIVENSQAANYKSGVKLEQNGSFFRIIVKGCYPRGYTTKEEAAKRYEELTEVK